MSNFDDWWNMIGSAIRPEENSDTEEHSKAISMASWNAAIDAALKSSRAKIERAKDENGEWYTRCVVIEKSILRLKK